MADTGAGREAAAPYWDHPFFRAISDADADPVLFGG
jgi:hypothetical protein